MPIQKLMNITKTLKNHWKKTLFLGGALTYGIIYFKNTLDTKNIMKAYCTKALDYGSQPIDVASTPRRITIILNPSANNRKCVDEFDRYCAPLLHLAGIIVDVKRTEHEGHGKTIIETIDSPTDAIVIAGGDGTVSEVVTGLFKNFDDNRDEIIMSWPMGVLPLGRNNCIANRLFCFKDEKGKVKKLAEATMAIIEGFYETRDVMKVQVLNEGKAVYALDSIKWGAFNDVENKVDNYWYFGRLKRYAAYIFNGFKKSLTWHCDALLRYNLPCEGCTNCKRKIIKNSHRTGWLQKFVKEENVNGKYLSISNPECSMMHDKEICTTDFCIKTLNSNGDTRKLIIELGDDENSLNYMEFVKRGCWTNVKNLKESFAVRFVEIIPTKNCLNNSYYSIDNELFEVKEVQVEILGKVLKMFCNKK